MKKFRMVIVLSVLLASLSMVTVAMAAAASKDSVSTPIADIAPIAPLANIEATVWWEGFDNLPFPPTGWGTTIVTDAGSGTPTWSRETVGTYPTISPHSGAAMAKFNSFNVGANDGARLYTHAFSLTGVSNPAIRFWMSHDTGYSSSADRIKVQVSTDGGTSYTTIGTVNRYDASCTTPCWKEHVFSLSAYSGETNVRIGFLAHSAYGNNMFLDDVRIEVDGADLSSSTKSAPSAVLVGEPITYSIHIINTGNQTTTHATLTDVIPSGTEYITGSLSCSGGSCTYLTGSDTVTWTGTLAPAAAVTLTFAVDTDLTPCGNIVNSATISDTGLIGGAVVRQATTQVIYYPPILKESFDDATFPPAGWGTTDVTGTTVTDWTRETVGSAPTIYPHSGAAMARYNSYSITSGNSTRLYSKVIDLSTLTHPMLTFWMSHDDLSANNDRLQVQISTDGGTTYTNVGAPILRFDSNSWIANWQKHTVDLSAYAGQSNVRIAFLGISAYGRNIFLDDVTVADPWSPCPHISFDADQHQIECAGKDTLYNITALNATPTTQTISLNYYNGSWPLQTGPASVVLGPAQTQTINTVVHIPGAAARYSTDTFSMTATAGIYGDVFTGVTEAGLISASSDKANLPTGRLTRDHSVVYYNGKLYRFGGYDYTAEPYVDIYDIATDTWSTGANMPGARYWIDCVAIGSLIYCAGGYSTTGQTTLYIYNPSTDSWSTGTTMPESRYAYAGVALGGKYYVIGGYTTSVQNTVVVYDPVLNTWSNVASMNTARRYPMAGVINGKIYVAGGYNGTAITNTAEVYDPTTDTWSYIANLPATMTNGTPIPGWTRGADAVLFDRYLVIVGGASSDSSVSNVSNTLAYDAVSDQWKWLPNYNHKVYSAAADSDGSSVWVVSGRIHEYGAFAYSRYTSKLLACGPADADLNCLKLDVQDPVTFGAPITYTVYITNSGVSDTWNAVITDTLPVSVTFVSASSSCSHTLGVVNCNLGNLSSGQSTSITIAVTAPSVATVVTNTVSVSSDEIDLNLANNTDVETTAVTNASIALTKLACTDPLNPSTCGTTINVLSGATVYYQYIVQNTGLITFTTHTLVDSQLGTLLSSAPYTLTPGATFSVITSTVILTDTTNTATWTASDGTYTVNNQASATVNVVPASIILEKTVGTDPQVCAATNTVTIGSGWNVTYCYKVTNTSPAPLTLHSLTDSELGVLLNNFTYTLTSGASVFVTETVNITQTTVNTATWTAQDGLGHTAIATDTAYVNVVPVLPGCGLPLEDFNAGTAGFPPAGWEVINNGGTYVWQSSQFTGRSNQTGGTGYAADADSDEAGSSGSINSDLKTPFFSLASATSPVLVYRYDYYDNNTGDTGYVDISTDGGATWTNLKTYTISDRGPKTAFVDLSAYAGQPLVQIRFKYVDASWDWWFEVDDVQVACSNAADISVTPSSISKTMLVGQTDSETLNIANLGFTALNWMTDEGCGTPVAWMEISPTLGTVNPLASQNIAVNFDTTALSAGVYNSAICVNSDDPDEPTVTIPVTLTVSGQPVISVTPNSLSATQLPDQITTQPITITNSGNVSLTWQLYEIPGVVRANPEATAAARAAQTQALRPEDAMEVVGGSETPASLTAPAPVVVFAPEAVLYDNGPLITHPTGGASGAAASALQTALGMSTYGFGHNQAISYSVADDFVVPAPGWQVNSLTFFAYQTGSSTASTITGVYYRIWDGDPRNATSNIVFGDLTTNRMTATTWSGIYRVQDSSLTNTQRPIMANTASGGFVLPPGHYWVEWGLTGSLASGPWVPPITILGQTTTGDALQNQNGTWVALADDGTNTPQGLPFIIEGESPCVSTDVPWLSATPISGTVAPAGDEQVVITFDSTGLTANTYTAQICLLTNDPVNPIVTLPVTMTVEFAAVPTWQKEVWINGEMFSPSDSPFDVANGTTVTIVDKVLVTSNDPVTYTLEELLTGNLELVDATADFGVVITGPNSISWEVSGGLGGEWYLITKTFMVNADLGWLGHITETLSVVNGPDPIVVPLDFSIPAIVDKEAPAQAYPGDVIPYTITINTLDPLSGTALLTDTLPAGVQFAGNLTATFGTAWYDSGAVYWAYSGKGGQPKADVIQDGSFELGTPNPYWTETSLHTFPLICDASCGVNLPHTGSWFVWLGGWGNEAEQGSVDQDVTIPNGVATLSLWLLMGRSNTADVGFMTIEIDDTPVYTVTQDDYPLYNPNYAQIVVDVSQYADGGVHNVKIYEENPAGNPGNINFFVDDVVLDVVAPPNPTAITITFDVSVTATSGVVVNTAELNFNGTMTEGDAATTIIPVADLSVTKSDSADPVLVGDIFTFTLAVENLGPSAAADVVVQDTLPAGVSFVSAVGCTHSAGTVSCNIGALGSGASALRYIAVQAETTGVITNTATVSASTLDPDTANNTDSETTLINLPEADLAIAKHAPTLAYTGDIVTYTIVITNLGPNTALSVVVTDTLPSGTSLVHANSTHGACTGTGPVVCELGDLTSGESATITLSVTAPGVAGNITNTAEVTTASHDPDADNNSASATTNIQEKHKKLYLPIILKG